jgi:lysophospholipase L1-like esterase
VNADSTKFYDFNKVRIYTSLDTNSYIPVVNQDNVASNHFDYNKGLVEYTLKNYIDTLYLSLEKTDTAQNNFTLYGIELMNDNPGIVYNAIGVNGASLPSFLRCQLFEEHLSILKADMVVISIGTNDGNTRRFDREYYKSNYDTLIQRIRNANPETAILLTVPNDSYLYRKYINKNTAEIEKVIIELAKEYNCGVWDFYKIMGGLNSIYVWQREGLAKYDKIHFNWRGYMLKGDMLFNAILKSYDNHLELIKR